jgi:Caspase domain
MEPTGRDTLIAFAAAPGQEAADGGERNSPFTAALLRHMNKPGLEVSVMLKDVSADVRRDTRNSQRPQQLSDMSKAFYFAKLQQAETTKTDAPTAPELTAKTPAAAGPSADDRALDVAFWNAAQSVNDCDAVRAYLQRFPSGVFVELARLSEKRLCGAPRKVTVLDQTLPDPPPLLPPAATATPAPTLAPGPAAASVAVAALPAKPAALPEVKATAPSSTEFTRVIQLELIRLGCGPNEASGTWTTNTREGLRKFNKFMRAKLNLNEPANDTIMALQRQKERACPLECERGYAAKGNICVALKVEPKKATRRAERVEKRRPRVHAVREAAPASAPAPAPQAAPMGGGPMFMPMMGGFGFRFGRH